MQTGRVVVFPRAFAAALEEFPIPCPGPGQILVRAEFSAISAGTGTQTLYE